ncbi:MAG: hypothetical protein K5829_14285 [Treponema sp.]|nr:hypothetical protein [Treponema sp.]
MKKEAKLFTVIAVLISFVFPVFSASAKVTYVKGKVEVNRNNEWIPLKAGDLVSETEMLSTGFQSEARLNYNGSIMALAALTRITLSQLRSSGKKDFVDVYVDTGVVRSKVTHVDRDPPDYKTRTAVAVASVRGTDYVTYASGVVSVFEGAVAVAKNFEGKKTYEPEAPSEEEESSEEEASEEESDGEGEGAGEAASEAGAEVESSSDSAEEGAAEDGASEDAGSEAAAASDSSSAESNASDDAAPAADNNAQSESSSDSNATASNDGSATATTPANQINSNATAGTVVVGASQSTNFDVDGSITNPLDNAKKSITGGDQGTKTAAEADSNSSSTTSTTPVKTSLRVVITVE